MRYVLYPGHGFFICIFYNFVRARSCGIQHLPASEKILATTEFCFLFKNIPNLHLALVIFQTCRSLINLQFFLLFIGNRRCDYFFLIYQYKKKQGPQQQSSLKSLKFNNPHRYRALPLLQPSEITSLSNSRWQKRKERPNRPKNKGGMGEKAKLPVSRWVSDRASNYIHRC